MTIRRAVPFLFASLLSLPCLAGETKVGGASITLTVPAGHCELEAKQAGDARMLQTVREAIGSNTLLAMYADCKQLADWRTGKRGLLEDFAQYQTLTAAMDAPPESAPAQTLKQLCAHLREEGEKLMVGMAPDVKQRLEQLLKDVQVNQIRFLGVVADDADACYSATAQLAKAQTGKDITIVGLSATTFVKGKLVYSYLYAPYRSGQTVTTLLAKQKLNIAALLAANKE
jgi:hypothetical protein